MSQPETRPGSFAELVRAVRTSSAQTTLARALLGAIAGEQPSERRRQRWNRAAVAALIVVGLAGFAAVWWLVAAAALYGWQTTNWDPLNEADFVPGTVSLLVIVLPMFSFLRLPLRRDETLRLLDAIAAGDDHLAPPVSPQPKSLLTSEIATGPESFRFLRALPSWGEERNPLLILPLLILQVPSLTLELVPRTVLDEIPYGLYGISMADLFIALSGLSLVLWVAALILVLRGWRHRLRVTVDDTGVAWRRLGWWRAEGRASWGSVRSFFTDESNNVLRTVYVLDMGDSVLAWTLSLLAKDAERAESDRLVQLILAHTRLPLRTLAPLLASLGQARGDAASLQGLGLPTDLPARLAKIPRRPIRRVLRGLAVALPLAAVLYAAPLVAGSRLQDYQQTYFAGLPPQIHAETPLFQDPLTYDDGNWFVAKPSAEDNEASYAFVDGAYQLTGRAGQFVDAWIALVYADAAVEVTARQVGHAPKSGYDGVGLVVRLDGDQGMVAFYVSPTDGSWTLAHYRYNADNPDYSWEYMGYGTSSAIQRGDAAVNRLLVLMRGSTFLLYVNDHFIDSFTDRYHEIHNLLPAGHVGVYLNEGATIGIFTNFAVYPVKSPPSLSYV